MSAHYRVCPALNICVLPRRTLSDIYRPASAPRVKKERIGEVDLQPARLTTRANLSSLCGLKLKIFGLSSGGGEPVVWDFFTFDTVRTVLKTVRDQLNISR